MIQIYLNDDEYVNKEPVYDSRLQDCELLELLVETGLNKGGATFIKMPKGHRVYDAFVSYRTPVTIYRDGVLLFRGRALYPHDDFYQNRTITCEGEKCFLRDGVIRPYVYHDTPAAIFTDVIERYNAQVEAFKQFVVGTVNVTDPNDYIRLENETAEQALDVIDKLVERCGGYIVFTTNERGQRCINWYDAVAYANNQSIEFGENLLDFTRTDENTDLATRIIPYGAKDETTGERITITSVNGGQDYIEDSGAVTQHGVIAKAVYWDDITEPENLLTKAQQYLADSKNIVTQLELTAVDLSMLDKNIDSFRIGDIIHVRSKPHGVDADYQLTERRLNLLNPADDRVVMGKSIASLTGATASGDRQNALTVQKVERQLIASYNLNVAAVIEEAKLTMTSLIQQTSDALKLEVAEQYATNSAVESAISTSMTQLADSFTFLFTQLQTKVDENDAEAREQLVEIRKYIRFENGNAVFGETGNEITLRLENDRLSFLDDGAEVAYLTNKQLTVLDGHFLNSLRVGKFAFLPRANGNLSLLKVGD